MRRSSLVALLAAAALIAGFAARDATAGNCPPQICGAGVGSWGTAPVPPGGLRDYHSATLLNDGRVFLTGGILVGDPFSPTATSLLYSPSSNTWTVAAAMPSARMEHTATLLRDGRVLVAGGTGSGAGPVSTAAIYDPMTNTWTAAGPMSSARIGHSAHRLADGRVLVAGGNNGATLGTAELFDPATGVFMAAGLMTVPRESHASMLRQDGTVLACGGALGGAPLDTCEAYDPTLNAWSNAGTTTPCAGRAGAETWRIYGLWVQPLRGGDGVDCGGFGMIRFDQVAVLDNSYVIFFSGANVNMTIYNPSTFGMVQYPWIYSTAAPVHPGVSPGVTRLYDGRVLIAGGGGALLFTLDQGSVNDNDGDGYSDGTEHELEQRPATYCATMRADVKRDGIVNVIDLSRVAQQFGVVPVPLRYDQNADATINVIDLQITAAQNGKRVVACP